jgi:hypothetical protein
VDRPDIEIVEERLTVTDLHSISIDSSITPNSIGPFSGAEGPWQDFSVGGYSNTAYCGRADNSSPVSSTESQANYLLYPPHAPALVPDTDISTSDLPYFTFFLYQMSNVLPYVNLFQSVPGKLFSRSLDHPALRYSVLSVSALRADRKRGMDQGRALELFQKSLISLQESLNVVRLDEGVVISIFLLCYFNITSGEVMSARNHLAGLHLVLTQMLEEHKSRNRGLFSPYAISPLTRVIWRMAIRMDFIIAMLFGLRPVFPPYSLVCED